MGSERVRPKGSGMVERKKRAKSWKVDAIRFAEIFAAAGFKTQAELASKHDITQATVSRYLNYAFGKKILIAATTTFHAENIPDELRSEWQHNDLCETLGEKVKGWVPQGGRCDVSVFKADDRKLFCALAAPKIAELLATSKVIGVSLGGTIAELIDALKTNAGRLLPEPDESKYVIPVVGDLTYLMNQKVLKFSASNLAAKLNQIFRRGSIESLPTLSGVPAYVCHDPVAKPGKRRAFDPRGLQRWIERIPGYRQIFIEGETGKPPRLESIDCLLTGLGVVPSLGQLSGQQPELGAALRERIQQSSQFSEKTIAEHAYGEIGGFVVGKKDDDPFVQAMNHGWNGIQAAALLGISRRAVMNGTPGVVVLAAGSWKSAMAKVVIQKGFCNHLVADASLADALKNA